MFYNLYLDKVCCKVFCIDTVLYDVKFQLIMRTFFLLILTESHVTSYRRITQKHDRMEPVPLPWCWYNFPTEVLRNTDRELFLEETEFGSKLDCVPVHNYG